MNQYEIPDPFETFLSKKYQNFTGAVYDFFAKEWSYDCSSCGDALFAPTKSTITKTRLHHTRNVCLGGY